MLLNVLLTITLAIPHGHKVHLSSSLSSSLPSFKKHHHSLEENNCLVKLKDGSAEWSSDCDLSKYQKVFDALGGSYSHSDPAFHADPNQEMYNAGALEAAKKAAVAFSERWNLYDIIVMLGRERNQLAVAMNQEGARAFGLLRRDDEFGWTPFAAERYAKHAYNYLQIVLEKYPELADVEENVEAITEKLTELTGDEKVTLKSDQMSSLQFKVFKLGSHKLLTFEQQTAPEVQGTGAGVPITESSFKTAKKDECIKQIMAKGAKNAMFYSFQHPSGAHVKPAISMAAKMASKYLKIGSRRGVYRAASTIHYYIATVMPFARGSAAVSEWIVRAMLAIYEMRIGSINTVIDIQAFQMTLSEFQHAYLSFYSN